MKRTVDTMCKLSIAPVPSFVRDQLELAQVDVRELAVLQTLRDDLRRFLDDLVSRKPTRRLIFDGPLVFTNFYREG